MYLRGRHLLVLGGTAVLAIVVVLGGVVMTGQAATVQQVVATNVCQPSPNAKPGTTIGCVLTVTNNGANSANSVVVSDLVSGGGTLLTTSNSRCTISGNTLTCTIGKLTGAGTSGATFSETHDIQLPDSIPGAVDQTVSGRYSPKPNSRDSDQIGPVLTTTTLDDSDDFDAKLAKIDGDSVQTGQSISGSNPYSTGATVSGTTAFASGLWVREVGSPTPDVCPDGCYGAQMIEFHINPLTGTPYPASFTMTIVIAGEAIGAGTKKEDLDVRHHTTSGTYLTPNCTTPPALPATDPTGDCVVSKSIEPSTKEATIVITGPGTGNGPWGVG
jgi:uncharacterized repeat protein (TIGR01451 family)